MNLSIRAKLSVMMFLQYVIYGAWLPLLTLYLGKYLNFNGDERGFSVASSPTAILNNPSF
jgi:Nucleoside H+ symporter